MKGIFVKVIKADKLQIMHYVFSRLRALIWRNYCRIALKKTNIGNNILCIGWPRLTNRNGELVIGDDCSLGVGILKTVNGAKISIGQGVQINHGFVLSSSSTIDIGKDTLIGENVSIRDSDHSFNLIDVPISKQGYVTKPIKIGKNVWIGRGSVILKGVNIGDGAIIGANSVVNKNVEALDIVAGNPSRLIRSRKTNSNKFSSEK